MEELQDAIEDAQYMNAVHDDNPRPIAEWKTISQDKLHAYIAAVEAKNPNLLTMECICERPLGLYFVSILPPSIYFSTTASESPPSYTFL